MESTTGSDEEEWPPSFYGSSQQSLPVAPTKTGWRRLLVCIGIKIFGKKQQDACDAVGISRSMFSTGGWLQTAPTPDDRRRVNIGHDQWM